VAEKLSISQLNKIGERLRRNRGSDEDLRLLDAFRLSFTPAYERVFDELSSLGLNPGGRPQKTTLSIIAKLNRERTRLSTMQDIAGCRAEVENLPEQDRVIEELKNRFPGALVHDRRTKPSHEYRAVHLVVEIDRHPVEIQIRTSLQHSWASTTEKLSDVVDPQIKYGGGPKIIQELLKKMSEVIAVFELIEKTYIERSLRGIVHLNEEQIRLLERDMITVKQDLKDVCQDLMIKVEGNNDFLTGI
jgi:GTP pyrophosphokinase